MSICSQICQHPTCWQSELNAKKQLLLNANSKKDFNKNEFKKEDNSENKIQYASLPTYKIVNLLELHNGDLTHKSQKNSLSENCLERRSLSDSCLPICPNVSVNESSSKCIKKIWSRQKVLEELETLKILSPAELSFNVFNFDNDCLNDPFHGKIIRWVPGKNVLEIPETSERKLSTKTIDGELLPDDIIQKTQPKQTTRTRSPLCRSSFKQKEKFFSSMLPFDDDIDTYGLGFFDDVDLYPPFLLERFPVINQSNVKMPTPLRTNRVQFYDYPTISTFQENLKKAQERKLLDKPLSPTQPKLLYIKDGRLLSRSPSFVRKPKPVKTKREMLKLTKVSVPRKAIKKYPIFKHCMCSIKQTKLSGVQIQPISNSEESSTESSRMSLVASASLSRHMMDDAIETSFTHYQQQQQQSTKPAPDNSRVSKLQIQSSDSLPCIMCGRTKDESTRDDDDGTSHTCFPMLPRTPPSAIFITDSSELSEPELENLQQIQSKSSCDFSRRDLLRSRHQSYSAPSSPLGKFSSDDMNTDKDIIKRTYQKYQSLSPYKTPLTSNVCLNDTSKDVIPLKSSKIIMKRVVLHESKQDFSQYLPEDEHETLSKTSFIARSLSPSISMNMRQQKQPPANAIPSEMKISQVQLNPLPTKTGASFEYGKLKKESKETSEIGEHVKAPPPSPNTQMLTPNVSTESIHEDNGVSNTSHCETYEKEIFVKLHDVYEESTETNDDLNDENEKLGNKVDKKTLSEIPNMETWSSHFNDLSEKGKKSFVGNFLDGKQSSSHVSVNSIDSEELLKIRNKVNEMDAKFSESYNINKKGDGTSSKYIEEAVSDTFNDDITQLPSPLPKSESQSPNIKVSDKFDLPANENDAAIDKEADVKKDDSYGNDEDENLSDSNVSESESSETSLNLDPISYHDFTEGIDFDLELDEEIVRAMNGEEINIDDFIQNDE